jgi:hypothetical protein
MAWRAITETDLLQRISGDELEALRASALDDDQTDPVAEHISQTTELVRGYIAACSRNELGADGTIPERLIRAACDLLVVDVSSRSAGLLIDLNDTRKAARDAAIRLLEQVAACRFAIEQPDDAGDDSPETPAPSMYDKTLYFSRAAQDGV